MISIIVLTYNQEQYIAQTLDSILMQQVSEPYEILIGNDCSTDATEAIALRYQEQYPNCIRVITHATNKGLVGNFIAMVEECRGGYIALCDGDDYWIDPLKLQKQVDYLQEHDDCVLVHTGRKLLVGDEFISQPFLRHGTEPSELFFHCYVCVPTVLMRAEPVRSYLPTYKVLYAQQQWRMQDYPLWLYFGTIGTFHYMPEEQVVYRVLQNTLSREKNRKRKYIFDKSVLDVKLYFVQYYPQFVVHGTAEWYRFQEMVFHARKRMLLDYKWIAREQVLPLVYTPLRVWMYMIRKKIRTQ